MDEDIPIVYCVAIVVSYLFGLWIGYKFLKKEGEK